MTEPAVNWQRVRVSDGLAAGTKEEEPAEQTVKWERIRDVLNSTKFRGLASILIGAAAWEFGARYFLTKSLFFVPLSAVFEEGVTLWNKGQLQHDIWVSGVEFSIAFVVASAAGILGAMLMAASKVARDFLDPWVSGLYSTPIVALSPLFILWFGIDIPSKVAIIITLVIFPVLINTFVGLTTTDRNLIEAARSFSATTSQLYMKVRVPAALPFILAGLRLGVARGLVGVVVGEMIGARAGLGYLIIVSAQTFDTAGVFLGVLILAISGVIVVELLKMLERWQAPWQNLGAGE